MENEEFQPANRCQQVIQEPESEPAGFNERFLAYFIDAAPFVAGAVYGFPALVTSGIFVYSPATEIKWRVFCLLLYIIYQIVFTSGARATLGKYLIGIRVVSLNGSELSFAEACIRVTGYFISAGLLNLGYLMALVTSERRALHDYLGGSRVISVRERGDFTSGLVIAFSWAIIVLLSGAWIRQNLLHLSAGERKQVAAAQLTIAKIAKLEEIYKYKYGNYTEDLKRLAELTGKPTAVRTELLSTLQPDSLELSTNGREYRISAKAKNWRKTPVFATSQ